MKAYFNEEEYPFKKVKVKKGIKLKIVEDKTVHPMCGKTIKYKAQVCPHGYVHPEDVPFTELEDWEGTEYLCPKGCFKIT